MYYSIENSTGKDVGNVFPQVSCLNQDLAHSIQFNEFSNFDSEIQFKLEPKAKLTDILSQAAISAPGFLINDKARQVIEGFNLMEHRYYKCLVKDQMGLVHDYYWLHLVKNLNEVNWLDYENSTFYVKEFGFRENDIPIKSYQDYNQKSMEVGDMAVIIIETIKVKENTKINADLFTIPLLTTSIFISERLKRTLEESETSGISTTEAF